MKRPHLPSVVAPPDVAEAPDSLELPAWHPYGPVWHNTVRSYLGGHIRAAAPVIGYAVLAAMVLLGIVNFVMALFGY